MADLVDREALKSAIFGLTVCPGYEREYISAMFFAINNAPSVDAEPVRHGYWTPVRFPNQAICSVCGGWSIGAMKYCPNCGAKIDGEDKREE